MDERLSLSQIRELTAGTACEPWATYATDEDHAAGQLATGSSLSPEDFAKLPPSGPKVVELVAGEEVVVSREELSVKNANNG